MLTKTGTMILLAQDFSVDPPRNNPNDVCARCHAGKADHNPKSMTFYDVRTRMRERAMPSGATSEDEHWNHWASAKEWEAEKRRAERAARNGSGRRDGHRSGGSIGLRVPSFLR